MKLKYVSLQEALAFAEGKTVAHASRTHGIDHDRLTKAAKQWFGMSSEWEDYSAVRFTDGTGLLVTSSSVGGYSEYTPEGEIVTNLCIVEDWVP